MKVVASPDFASAVLADLLLLALATGVAGLVVFRLVRVISPLRRWGSHGNVFTGPLGPVDLLLAAGGLIFLFRQLLLGAGVEPGPVTAPLVALNIVVQCLVTAALLFYLGFLRRIDLDELFGLRRMSVLRIWSWALTGTVVVVIPGAWLAGQASMLLMERADVEMQSQVPVKQLLENSDLLVRGLMMFSAVVGAAVSEELVFRGFIYPVVKKYSDRFFAAFFSAFVFALVHTHLGGVLPLWFLGICFALALELSGCLWVPIAMHAMFNAFNIALVLYLGGSSPPETVAGVRCLW